MRPDMDREYEVVLYTIGPFSVRPWRGSRGYAVYQDGVTAATLCATIDYGGKEGFSRAMDEADRRMKQLEEGDADTL